ncbi:solute carrier family 46 member 3 isoform X2 [Nilaparvata lugens]|uniref:solute carrier family 46 member 3 isoform X2 n=1 Tax=Nilaparvata lugens TaxID=108931 RepID=UPI00193D46AE|nr:solute carrier family 46 member 3 isoform X2 [Nilaparvata lugens]
MEHVESHNLTKENTMDHMERNNLNNLDVKRTELTRWNNWSVELVLFLYFLAYMMTSVIEESLFIDKACRINLNISANICDHISLKENESYKKKVQLVVSNFRQYESVAMHAVPTVLGVFVGAWSDRHGRKLPMLMGLSGAVLYAAMLIVNIVNDWPLESILYTATFPAGMTGSGLAIFLAAFTYISDITTPDSRTHRISLLEVAYLIPMPTGVALGSYIFTNVVNRSYLAMFSIQLALQVVAFLYACLTMKCKTNHSTVAEHSGDSHCFWGVCNWNIVVETWRTLTRKHPNNRRILLIAIICAMGLYTFQRDEKHIFFLYTQLKFHWSVSEFSKFRTFHSSMIVVCLLAATPLFTKVFGMRDTIVASIGCLAHASGRVIFSLAQQRSTLYCGAAVASLGTIVAPVLRSITSKLIPPSERGKAFSLLTVADQSVPIISGALFSQIYNATIDSNPAAFFSITIISQLGVLFFVMIIHCRLGGRNINQAEDSRLETNSD